MTDGTFVTVSNVDGVEGLLAMLVAFLALVASVTVLYVFCVLGTTPVVILRGISVVETSLGESCTVWKVDNRTDCVVVSTVVSIIGFFVTTFVGSFTIVVDGV